jgi:hypothetical protein
VAKAPKTPKRTYSLVCPEEANLSPKLMKSHYLVRYKDTAEYQASLQFKGAKKPGKKRHVQKRCWQCRKDGNGDTMTIWVCPGCNNAWLCGLHTRNCFQRWHMAVNIQVAQSAKLARLGEPL